MYVGPEFITPIPTRIDIGAAAATLCTRLQLRIPCPSVVLEELEAIGLTVM